MTPPTSEQCNEKAPMEAFGAGAFAAWYPQMGGYVGCAVVIPGDGQDDCFDVLVWHDGSFPFADGREPVRLHHCVAEQFVEFGRCVQRICAARTEGVTMPFPILQFFDYAHLPDNLAKISRPFSVLAEAVAESTSHLDHAGDAEETEQCLRKLLEAKDCAVRAALLRARAERA